MMSVSGRALSEYDIERIRRLFRRGMSKSAISRYLDVDRKTVQKYCKIPTYSPSNKREVDVSLVTEEP